MLADGIAIFSRFVEIMDPETAFGTGLITGLEITDAVKEDLDDIVCTSAVYITVEDRELMERVSS